MPRNARYLFVLFLLPAIAIAQLKVVKPVKTSAKKTNFGFGVGGARSVLYLTRNINSNNDALGLNTIVTFDKGNFVRASLEYTYYGSIDIRPTWFNVKAQTLEANVNIISKSKSHTFFFYPIAGISYNVFKGYYTGVNDYLNLSSLYHKNENVRTAWLGLNTGLGFDYNFRRGAVYFNYKMRIGRTEGFNQVNIMDVFMGVGLRCYVKGTTIYRLFRGTRSRYLLDKKEPSR